MQRALLIDEIIRHIFQGSLEDGLGTLNALARSCRAWEGPALDYLWTRLFSIAPLLHLIPSVQLVNGIYVLEQTNISPDLTRFHLYARRVKYIAHRQNVKVHPAILSLLTTENGALAHPVALLPSLRSAQISTSNCDIIQACLSLSDKLANLDLDLGFKSRGSHTSNEHIRQYLQEVVRIAPDLQRLSIRGSITQNLLGLVTSMRNLHTLSLRLGSSLTMEVLLAVATFPNLSELELHAGHLDADDLSDALRIQDLPVFPSLKILRMRAHTPVLELIINNIPADTLHTLRVEAEDPSGVSVAWSNIFKAICYKAANTLQNLTLEHHIELDDVDIESAPSADTLGPSPGASKTNTPIPFDDLKTLRSLRHLRHVVFDTTLPPAVSDEEMTTLVTAWPELRHLDIGTTLPSGQAKLPTFLSLNALATRAPKLEALVMSADISGIESATILAAVPRQHALMRLTLACTSTSDPEQVARYLHRLFPSLIEVDGLPEREEEWGRIRDALQRLRLASSPQALASL
ncbi:hypothetical protein D9615_007435 [Tricholomella constricta]|uniref:F-box domain-containing protein n=1 Tax=Tricholomella constricta TaxID=117010 RepID=A0A8H5GYE1_9AGAR|nr:hypothetical protein D9615_007435 [Tricholomella constricta]